MRAARNRLVLNTHDRLRTLKGPSLEEDLEQRLRTAIEAVIGTAPYALCFDCSPIEDILGDDPATTIQTVQPLRQATYTTRGLFEAGCDILTCELREGDDE